MQWTDQMGNRYRLTWRPWPVDTMRFDGNWWTADERSEGVLVEMTTWHGETWFVRPEQVLFTRRQIEARDSALSAAMLGKVERVPCDCGCERSKPANEWSAAWQQAASMVRCEPLPELTAKPAA